jgi:integrase
MKPRFRIFLRNKEAYYIRDNLTGKHTSLHTSNKEEAQGLCAARNQTAAQGYANLAMAKMYLSMQSSELISRTWGEVMDDMAKDYDGSTLRRWQKVTRSAPFQLIRKRPLLNTQSAEFLAVLRHPRAGTSTQGWLRIMHNRALDLGWLLSPVLARRMWPKVQKKHRRAITWEEHRTLSDSEPEMEFRLYLEMLWETGGSQSDIAELHRDNVDMIGKRLYYIRKKLIKRGLGEAALYIDETLERLLAKLPAEGWLFPRLRAQAEGIRASRFAKRCHKFEFSGISLHSYRYSWAERAKAARMPEREAMHHLGHNSRAMHQHYSKKAEIVIFPLSYYEKKQQEKVIEFVHPQKLTA